MTETARIRGGQRLAGDLTLPGCKGISHRALVFAAMASGRSELRNVATGDDVARTATILRSLGVGIEANGDRISVESPGLDAFTAPHGPLDCGNSGSAMRFFLGLLAGRPFEATLVGDASLSGRPMERVVRPLQAMGAHIDGPDHGAHAPLAVHPARLQGATITPDVASAQVKTAVLLAGLQADGITTVIEPVPTRDHTERMLAAAGVDVSVVGDAISVGSGCRRPDPFTMTVPGDPSTAAFFIVAAAMTPGAMLTVHSVSVNPLRTGFLDVLGRMGASIVVAPQADVLGEPVGTISVTGSTLQATTIGGSEIPNVIDELPVLAVAAAVAHGETVVEDAAELRAKESDRIATTTEFLRALGGEVTPTTDGLRIIGPRSLVADRVHSHGDHRIAMSAAIAALAADGVTEISGWEAIRVSAPEFADDLRALGAEFV